MGNHNARDPELVRQIHHQLVDDGADDGVEARRGLIIEDDVRVEGQGPGQGYSLGHPAGDLRRHEVFGVPQAHQLQLHLHHDANDVLGHLRVLPDGQRHVLAHRHGVEQGAVLEAHPKALAHFVHLLFAEPGDFFLPDPDLALIDGQSADHTSKQRGLAPTAAAHNHGNLAPLGGEAHPVQHPPAVEALDQILHTDHDRRPLIGESRKRPSR